MRILPGQLEVTSVLLLTLISHVLSQGTGNGQRSSNELLQKTAFCDNSNIYFMVTFERPFTGILYTDGTYGDPNCRYVDGSVFPSVSYNISIPIDRCGTERLPDGTRQNTVIVQRDSRILEVHDNKYVLSCNPLADAGGAPLNGQFTVTLGGISVGGTLASTQVISNAAPGAARPLDYAVEVQSGQGPFGPPVTRTLSVGEQISYVVRVRTASPIRLGRCWATDSISNIQLSDDTGCTLQAAGSVWGNFRTVQVGGDQVFYNDIKAWAFPTSDRVNILCNLHVCLANISCSSPNCVSGARQKDEGTTYMQETKPKRDLEMMSLRDMVTLQGAFQVQPFAEAAELKASARRLADPPSLVTGLPSTEVEPAVTDDLCLPRTNFIVGVSLVSLVMFLALTVTGTVVYRFRCKEILR